MTSATTPNPLSDDRLRPCIVQDHGTVMVSRHITRVDGPRCCGWQVRYSTPTKYFGDGCDSWQASLNKAKQYLVGIYRGEPKHTTRGRARRHGARAGVRVIRNRSGHWYAEATHPIQGRSPRRFYIGTDSTRTATREKRALTKARTARRLFLESCPVPRR